jgi:hypothetical protein
VTRAACGLHAPAMRLPVLAVLSLVAFAPAQVFVVDAANGPGAHFTSIAAATAAVPDGAVLDVRAGTYQGFTITAKGLTLVAAPGVVVDITSNPWSTMLVQQLQPHQHVVLRGLSCGSSTGSSQALFADQCLGTILIDGLTVVANTQLHWAFRDCDRVVLRDLQMAGEGWSGLGLVDSHAIVERCEFGAGGSFAMEAGSGVQLDGGSLQVVDCEIGNGVAWFTQGSAIHVVAPGDLRVLGTTVLRGNNAFGGGAIYGLGITGQGTVRVAPSVAFVQVSTVYGSGINAVVAPMPAMRAPRQLNLASVSFEFASTPGTLGALFAALPGPRTHVPGWSDPSWQDGATLIPLVAGIVPPSGQLVFGATVSLPFPVAVVGQGLAWSPATGIELSNPAFALVR